MNIKLIVKNKVMIYLVSRYLTYFVQFITSLIIAVELGPYYLGIWGFVLLLLQYFQQFHFGIANSFNVLYVHHREEKNECDNYIGNSLLLISYLVFLVFCFFLYYNFIGIEGFDKYHADKYILWVCIIAILQYYVNFLLNLFRVKNLLNCVTFCQSVIVFFNFICVFFFKGEQLIASLIAGYILGNIMCVALAFISGVLPRFSRVSITINYQKEILKKGLFLFLYNSCFYFIIISIRTIISGNYAVEEFGMFTFSFSLAHAFLLIIEAMSFVIFPKVLGKLSSTNTQEIEGAITLLRNSYITSAHALIYFALVCFPVLLILFPQYKDCLISMNLIALTILMNTNSCGYMELLIAHNKEKLTAFLSAGALGINCLLALFMVNILQVSFSHVIIATMITYFLFTLSVVYFGQKLMGTLNIKSFLINYFPLRLFVPYILSLLLTLLGCTDWMIVTLILFLVLNYSTLRSIVDVVKTIMAKPDVINL